jgi:protein-S-isoprenylcysteine O-methyltransferase Ste14
MYNDRTGLEVRSMIIGAVFLTLYLAVLVAIPFITAGSVNWPMTWASMGIYVAISMVNFFFVDPELVLERSRGLALPAGTGTKRWDRALATASWVFFFPLTLLAAGLDIGSFGWSLPLPVVVQILALVMFALGNALGSWAMVRNRYFSTFVRLQHDRVHQVETQGPYRYVRHPGYTGAIAGALALPLALGSRWALLPAMVGASGFVLRTALEDRFLLEELDGYAEYATQVHYRLLPGVW